MRLPQPMATEKRFSKADTGETENAHSESPLAESPPVAISLAALHKRSSPLNLSHQSLSHGLDSARRLDALEWLVQAFDALDLADEQLFTAIGLLDRFAAASTSPIAPGTGAFALVLAAMLIALKVSGFKKDLERARKLVVEVSGSSRPWAAVRKAELNILRKLGFRACTPTSYHLLDRLIADTLHHETPAEPWDKESKTRCSNLARFLLEMCIIYDPEALYSSGRPPLLSAVSALLLSLLAHGAPRHYAQMLGDAIHLTESNRSTLTEIAEAMRNRWAMEEEKNGMGGNAIVLDKWNRRRGSFEVSPPPAFDLRALTSGIQMPKEKSLVGKAIVPPSPPKPQRRLSGAEVLSALPTPARRARVGEATSSSQPRSQPPRVKKEDLQRANVAVVTKEEDKRHQENRHFCHWPMPATATAATASASASGGDPEEGTEPLLELTHVLNMVAPRPSQKLQTLQAPSVAAELLVSSALRMHWPADKRRLAPKDAASTCREAASVLQEAISQLTSAAQIFETGGPPVREIVKGRTETKRRRTYAGPPPGAPGAVSPPVSTCSVLSSSIVRASSTAYRGSPPIVRTGGGLRV
ncbi:Cyclin N-terminal domain-containing protein [Durusdinium trenchii]